MEGWYPRCIFCAETLPPLGQRGKGEHIVPEFLRGSWCTKDVCAPCNRYFGAHVDPMALEDNRVIDAIGHLTLPDLKARLLDRATATTIDVDTGRPLRTKTKAGKLRIVRQDLDGVIDHDEADAFAALRRSALKRPPQGLSTAAVVEEIARLQALYADIQHGQMVTSPKLGSAVRKGRARTSYRFKTTPNTASRLIAKIAYEVAFLFLSINRLQVYWPSLKALSAHARQGQPIDEYAIFPQPTLRGGTYDATNARYGHSITCAYHDDFAAIDVSLFALADFRVLLLPTPGAQAAASPAPMYEGMRVSHARMVMTFEPGLRKEKLALLFLHGKDEPVRFVLTGRV